MKRLSLLGASGSIGQSTLQVVEAHPEELELVAVAARSRIARLLEIVRRHPSIRHVGIYDEAVCRKAREDALFPSHVTLHSGPEGLRTLAALPEAHTTLLAITGTAGLQAALDALHAGKTLALASKEILVLAGELVMKTAQSTGTAILPIDSEHNAAFQCLGADKSAENIQRLILTASGGALRDWPLGELSRATLKDTLKHPNWNMGVKITVDSATLANKGLELIEAGHLFRLQPDQLDAVLHKQSIVHALVEYRDGSIIAQLCPPSMTFPIQHALLYPERHSPTLPGLDFRQSVTLNFSPIDPQRYPMLQLARDSMRQGTPCPGIYNAANEVAVEAFAAQRISFTDIARLVERTLESYRPSRADTLDDILAVDAESRRFATGLLPSL